MNFNLRDSLPLHSDRLQSTMAAVVNQEATNITESKHEVTDIQLTTNSVTNSTPEHFEIHEEPADITAEIDVAMRNPSPGLNPNTMYQLSAMSAHHLQFYNMTNGNPVINARHMYDYVSEIAKVVKVQGGNCPEMVHTLGPIKKRLVRDQGITADNIRSWVQQNIEYFSNPELSPSRDDVV